MDSGERHVWEYRWVRDLAVVGGVALLFFLAYVVRAITIPVLIGLGLAYAFNPVITWTNRRWRWPRWLATVLVIFVVVAAVGGLLAYLAPLLVRQSSDLLHRLPGYAATLAHNAGPAIDRFSARVQEALSFGQAPATPGIPATQPVSVDVPVAPPGDVTATQPAATSPAWSGDLSAINLGTAGAILARVFNVGFSVVGSTLSVITYIGLALLIVALCFFFFSWRFDRVLAWFDQFIPVRGHERTMQIVGKMDAAVSAFIRGRLIQSVILATNLSIGWWIAGVPYFLLLGLICGVLNLVPYLSFFGWPVAVLLAWVDSAQSGQPFSVWRVIVFPTLAYLVPQQFDNWVVEPLVQGKATDLSPLAVLLAVLTGGSLFGLFGMILAIPTAACLKILLHELVLPRARGWAKEA